MPLDPKTYLQSLQQPSYEDMGQQLANQQQQANTAKLLGPEPPPEEAQQQYSANQVASMQGRLGRLHEMASGNNGLGGLAAGLHALFLAPKVRAAEAEQAKTQLMQQNLELDAKRMSNQQTQQQIQASQRTLDQGQKMDALSRIEGGTSQDLAGDAKLAGATMRPDGKLKTNYDYLQELQSKGQIKFNVQDVIKHSPGLILKLGQTYSPLTADGFTKELDEAGKEHRLYQQSLNELQKANVGKDPMRQDFGTYGTVLNGLAKTIQQVNDPASALDPATKKQITDEVIVPGLYATGKFAKDRKLAPDNQIPGIPQYLDAHFKNDQGDPSGIQNFITNWGLVSTNAAKEASKPDNTPDQVKTTTPPMPVASSGQDRNKKEIKKTSIDGLLPK